MNLFFKIILSSILTIVAMANANDIQDSIHLSAIVTNEKETAEKALKELDDGKKFSKVFKKYSINASSKTNGDLGNFSLNDLPEGISSVARTLKIGEHSSIIFNDNKYTIIQVIEPGKKLLSGPISDYFPMALTAVIIIFLTGFIILLLKMKRSRKNIVRPKIILYASTLSILIGFLLFFVSFAMILPILTSATPVPSGTFILLFIFPLLSISYLVIGSGIRYLFKWSFYAAIVLSTISIIFGLLMIKSLPGVLYFTCGILTLVSVLLNRESFNTQKLCDPVTE